MHVLDAPGCYERTARVDRKSALQGSGLVRTVWPCACAQRRVALMPQAIELELSNDRHKSAMHFERPTEQVLALATEPRAKREVRTVLCHTCQ